MDSLYNSFAFWFSGEFALFDNIVDTLTYHDGIFARWFLNTVIYVVVGAGGATLLATLAGYGLAKYNFPGRRLGLRHHPRCAWRSPPRCWPCRSSCSSADIGLTNTPLVGHHPVDGQRLRALPGLGLRRLRPSPTS